MWFIDPKYSVSQQNTAVATFKCAFFWKSKPFVVNDNVLNLLIKQTERFHCETLVSQHPEFAGTLYLKIRAMSLAEMAVQSHRPFRGFVCAVFAKICRSSYRTSFTMSVVHSRLRSFVKSCVRCNFLKFLFSTRMHCIYCRCQFFMSACTCLRKTARAFETATWCPS